MKVTRAIPCGAIAALVSVFAFSTLPGCDSGGGSNPQPGQTPSPPAPAPTVTVTPNPTPSPSPSPSITGVDLSGTWVFNNRIVCTGGTIDVVNGLTSTLTIDGNNYSEQSSAGACDMGVDGNVVFGEAGSYTLNATASTSDGNCTAPIAAVINGQSRNVPLTLRSGPMNRTGSYEIVNNQLLILAPFDIAVSGLGACSWYFDRA